MYNIQYILLLPPFFEESNFDSSPKNVKTTLFLLPPSQHNDDPCPVDSPSLKNKGEIQKKIGTFEIGTDSNHKFSLKKLSFHNT